MSSARLRDALATSLPAPIASKIADAYAGMEKSFALGSWKASGIDAGHFVESVRRGLEYELFGSFTPFAESLSSFSQHTLQKYESAPGKKEEHRILIPRALYAAYCVRNKRGIGHVAEVEPNRQDSTFIINSCKWVLAELVRLGGASTHEEAQQLVEQILHRHVGIVWDDGETFMILDPKMKAPERSLVVLYRQSGLAIEALREKVGYQSKARFKAILINLQKDALLSITPSDTCKLSPLGVRKVEELLLKSTA